MKSNAIRALEQAEKDIQTQARRVRELQNASIVNGYTSRGNEYEHKKKKEEQVLGKMSLKYQKDLNRASNILIDGE